MGDLASRRTAHGRIADAETLCALLDTPFSTEQLAAITAPLEPGVIIAGAGSGKTTVMAARVVWLVGTGQVRPEEVLGLTFTRKAAAELSTRVRDALVAADVVAADGVDEAGEQVIMTYDAFAARMVTEHGLRIGVEADPTMITGATRFRLGSRVVAAAAGPFEHISRLRPASITERVLTLDAQLQAHLVGHAELDRHAREYRLGWSAAPLNNRGNVFADVNKAMAVGEERLELASLVTDYQRLKARLGVVEFADQMAIAAQLAREVPEVSQVLRDTFKVVLLDEYQDTSAAQALMLQGLFSGPTLAEGRSHPVTAVGDPFQAIYGWRGAAASNILAFADDFPAIDETPARSFALTVNRRSGKTILEVANRLAEPLRGARIAGRDLSDNVLRAPREAGPGEVWAGTFDTWPEEVAWICDEIVRRGTSPEVDAWSEIAVLTRRNADIAPLYGELTARDVPVEIVGLGGLLSLPEVMDVVSTLRVIDDVTANPDVIRLLTGPRWNIGPRDLALLGRRAADVAGAHARGGAETLGPELLDALEEAVADIDPTEVVCLLDAVENPGEGGWSAAAQDRFSRFAAEMAALRGHSDEPVLDLTRRVIATLGLDVELRATPDFVRTSRRDQLAVFVDAVGDYVDVDGDASLSGLLAYLQAEVDQGTGLDQAVPSDQDAVKLLTVHKAKGLEWPIVFLPALMQGTFPSDRVTDNWVTNPGVLPAELRGDAHSIPQLADADSPSIAAYKSDLKEQQILAEDRLGYVAVTRAKRVLVGTGHTWRPDTVKPRVPSAYLTALLAEAARQDRVVSEAVAPGTENPLEVRAEPQPWPRPLDPTHLALRREAAERVSAARDLAARTGRYEAPTAEPLLLDEESQVAGWDADLERLLAEARQARRPVEEVELPPTLSATALLWAAEDPGSFAAELARPMPRRPSRAARFGTRFHAWVERHVAGLGAQPQLIDVEDLPDRADAGAEDDLDLLELCRRFAEGRFGSRRPLAVEASFALLVAGQVLRGRIDAVYPAGCGADGGDPEHDVCVVDWKTNRRHTADPLQLSLYRLAWSELHGVPLERVDAAFYYVREDELVRPEQLLSRAEVEGLLAGLSQG
ncbi:MAG: ATP-dependent DNA helicase [Propionibacteriaceae bacterium]